MDSQQPNKPTISVSEEHKKAPFWNQTKKFSALIVGTIVFIGIARTCGDKARPVAAGASQVPTAASPEALRQLTELRKQLEQKQSDFNKQMDAADSVGAPNLQDLTAAQQKAAVESSYGNQQWSQAQQRAAAAQTGEKPQPKDTTTIVSYRTEQNQHAGSQDVDNAKSSPESAEDKPIIEPNESTRLAAAIGPKYRIRQGTLLPCTQMIRINGSSTGHINCLISFPIFSTSGTHLLIPGGTLAIGKVQQVGSQGQERLFVSFDSLIMPDGFTVHTKDAIDGLDQIGQIGLRDKVNHHYGQIFGAGIALALVGGLAQIGNNVGSYSAQSQYRAGVTESMSQNAMQVMQRFVNVLPSFTIREGCRNNLYLPGDLYLPDYRNHTMEGEM